MDRYTETDAAGDRNPRFPLGYCPMSGHSQRGCSTKAEHWALIREGIGISRVPGPTERELVEETAADIELRRDEFHGRDPYEGWTESEKRFATGDR